MNYPYENLENFTLPSLLNRSVAMYEKQPALAKVGEEAMCYGKLNEKVQAMVQLLKENGISKGDKVVLLSENMPNWGVAYLSITYFGAIVVPILVDFHPSDVHHILRHSEAKAAFVSEKYLATIEESAQNSLKLVIKLDTLEIVSELSSKDYLSALKQRTREMTQRISNSVEKPQEDDLAAIIYTSGTTGHSKGVMLSHKNLVTNALSAYNKVTITKEDVFLSILPLAHTFECTAGFIVPILHGSSIYYIDKVPTPSVLLKAFEVVKPTMMFSVPLIMEKIYKNKILPKFTGSFIMRLLYKISIIRKILNSIAGKKLLKSFGGRLRFFGIGGAGLSPFVEQFLIEAGFPYVIGYGLTETSPLIAGSKLGEKPRFKSTGTPFGGVSIKIKDKDPQTGEGEIVVQSPSVMLGYYKDEAKTAEVMEDGWFLTGDLGYMDEDGFLYISGRSKNVIIGAGGENIFPEQIEAIINQQEAVLDSLVLQQEDKLIARIHLDYELLDKKFRANTNPDAKVKEEINAFLEQMRNEVNSQLASYSKIVKFVEQIEPFVKTPTKKIKRYLYTS
ncbi:MAG: AMP-binding protein [Sulfurimonas sp.]